MKKTFKELAYDVAQPHLGKEGVERVFVNENGLYWINNEVEQMSAYFEKKKENWEVFEAAKPQNKPTESEKEVSQDAGTETEAPKRKGKKK